MIASLAEGTLHELRAAAEAVALPLGLLPMRPASAYCAAFAASGLEVMLVDTHTEVEYYPTVAALMDSMRRIGAGNHMRGSTRAMTGTGRWRAMLQHYERSRNAQGIPATWEHLFLVVRKRDANATAI